MARMRVVKKLVHPGVLIPLLLVTGLVVALLSLTDIGKVLALIAGVDRNSLLIFLLLMVGYEIVRGAQWVTLLRALQVRAPLRAQVLAFAVAEVTKALPFGNYTQNYLLRASHGEDFGRSSSATALILGIEVVVSLVGVVILGDGSWTPWLRPLILAFLFGCAALIGLGVVVARWRARSSRSSNRVWVSKHPRLSKALDGVQRFREGGRAILRPRPLLLATALGALYLTIAGTGLYVIARGLALHVSFGDALAVYYLSLAIALLLPLPVDLGVIELGMIGAFAAVGVSRDAGLGVSLINRALSIVTSLLIACVVVGAFHRELRVALRGRAANAAPLPDASPHAQRRLAQPANDRRPGSRPSTRIRPREHGQRAHPPAHYAHGARRRAVRRSDSSR